MPEKHYIVADLDSVTGGSLIVLCKGIDASQVPFEGGRAFTQAEVTCPECMTILAAEEVHGM